MIDCACFGPPGHYIWPTAFAAVPRIGDRVVGYVWTDPKDGKTRHRVSGRVANIFHGEGARVFVQLDSISTELIPGFMK